MFLYEHKIDNKKIDLGGIYGEYPYNEYVGACKGFIDPNNGTCKNAWWFKNNGQPALGYDTPEFRADAFKARLNYIKYNNPKGVKFSFNVLFDYYFLFFYNNFQPNYTIKAPLKVNFFINGKLLYSNNWSREEINYGWNKDIEVVDYDLDTSLDNIEYKLVLESFQSSATNNFYKEYNGTIVTNNNNEINIDFNEDIREKESYIPIYFSEDLILYENIKIKNLVPKNFEFQENIFDLIEIEYKDELNNKVPILPNNIKLNIQMNGFENNFQIGTKWIQINENKFKLVVDGSSYYDYQNKIIKSGSTNIYDIFENFIVLPLDYYENYGNIKISFNPSQYTNKVFKINIPIGNKYSYRGNVNSKFYFSQKDLEYEFSKYDYIFNLNGDDLNKKQISLEDLQEWLNV